MQYQMFPKRTSSVRNEFYRSTVATGRMDCVYLCFPIILVLSIFFRLIKGCQLIAPKLQFGTKFPLFSLIMCITKGIAKYVNTNYFTWAWDQHAIHKHGGVKKFMLSTSISVKPPTL